MRVLLLALALSIALLALASACSRTGLLADRPDARHDARVADVTEEAPFEAAEEPGPDVFDGSACETGADCDDGRYCDVGTCDPARGCVFVPRACDDGVACTSDGCDEAKRACTHAPDDQLCSNDTLCSATRGCASFVYGVASDGHLYEVDVPSGQVVDVGSPSASTSDIALAPDGTLYLTDSYILYTLDRADAATTAVGSIMPLYQFNGLGSQPSGPLLATTADTDTAFDLDPSSAAATPFATIPLGYQASGDVTSGTGAARYMTLTPATAQPTDSLYRIDNRALVGDTGFPCVWGLATLGGTLYGLTCKGLLLSIDSRTGHGTMIAQSQPAFLGAAGR